MAKKPMTEDRIDAMMTAFTEAIDGLLIWEFGGAESKEEYDLHREAAEDVSGRIRKLSERFYKREINKIDGSK